MRRRNPLRPGILRIGMASASASSTAHLPRGRAMALPRLPPIPPPPDYSTPAAVRARGWERGSLDTTSKTWTPIAKDPVAYIKAHHEFMRKVRDAMAQERGAYDDFRAALGAARKRMSAPGWGKVNPMRHRYGRLRRNPAPRGSGGGSILSLVLLGGAAYLLLSGRLGAGFAFSPTPVRQLAPSPGTGLLSVFLPALTEGTTRVGSALGDWLKGVWSTPPATGEANVPNGQVGISTLYQPGEPAWWEVTDPDLAYE